MITKYILAILLVNPTTNVETQRFVVVETSAQCSAMLNHIEQMMNNPQMRENHRRNHPGGLEPKAARCTQIDLTNYGFKLKGQ